MGRYVPKGGRVNWTDAARAALKTMVWDGLSRADIATALIPLLGPNITAGATLSQAGKMRYRRSPAALSIIHGAAHRGKHGAGRR